MTLERTVTELCAPWVTNTALFLILGVGLGAPAPGVTAALLTGAVPMVIISWMIRRGRVGDHHVTARSQRASVFGMILGCLVLLCVALAFMATPREIWIAVAAAIGFIVLYSAVTAAGLKISLHVGLWLIAWAYLGVVVSPWWALVLVLAPVVAWSRVKLAHHTLREVSGGVLAGLAVLVVSLVFV